MSFYWLPAFVNGVLQGAACPESHGKSRTLPCHNVPKYNFYWFIHNVIISRWKIVLTHSHGTLTQSGSVWPRIQIRQRFPYLVNDKFQSCERSKWVPADWEKTVFILGIKQQRRNPTEQLWKVKSVEGTRWDKIMLYAALLSKWGGFLM